MSCKPGFPVHTTLTWRSSLYKGLRSHYLTSITPELRARLCNAVDIEIVGRRAMFKWPCYRPLLEKKALDIVQPKIQFAGGISEVMKIGFLAEIYGKRCISHFLGTGIALAAMLHVWH